MIADCAVRRFRSEFPCPLCTEGCDMLRGCEGAGHYVGFLTAQQGKHRRRQLERDGWTPLWKDDEFA